MNLHEFLDDHDDEIKFINNISRFIGMNDDDDITLNKAWKQCVSRCVLSKNKKAFLELLRVLLAKYAESDCTNYLNALEPLFITFSPRLSDVLSISHVFCENCCNLYTPCRVSDWIVNNPELFDSEIYFFEEVLERFGEDIVVDIVPYTTADILIKSLSCIDEQRVSTQHDGEKLKQLYSVILHHDHYE